MNVTINVLGSGQPSGGCSGAPVIASFDANPTTINSGQSSTLSCGKADNATSAVIDDGIGGVPTPGNTNVTPNQTTTYTLTATGCGGTVTRQVTIIVSSAAPPPPAPSLTFDFSPKTVAPGDYVTLTFSAPVASPTIRLGNSPSLVKMLGTADNKVWKALIPGFGVSDYLYVDYEGKTIKSAQPLTVAPAPPPPPADLSVPKVAYESGKVSVQIKNTGAADFSGNVHIVCVATNAWLRGFVGNPTYARPPASSDQSVKLSIARGVTTTFNPNISIDPTVTYLSLQCVAGLDGDPTPDDNQNGSAIP